MLLNEKMPPTGIEDLGTEGFLGVEKYLPTLEQICLGCGIPLELVRGVIQMDGNSPQYCCRDNPS